jgi:DNA-binding beta-propeller fold protein YncE
MRWYAAWVWLVLLGGFWLSFADVVMAAELDEFEPTIDFLELPEGLALGPCSAVSVSHKGEIYLLHRGVRPVLCFDAGGKYLRSWGDDLIQKAHGLRVDPDDNVWVTDIGSHRVFKFDPTGKLLLSLGTGQPGAHDDQFNKPSDVAFGSNGEFYVSDGYVNTRVMKFSSEGKLLKSWGTPGQGPSQFDLPHSIIVDGRGRVLVGDRNNNRIQVFDGQGKHLESWNGIAAFGLAFNPEGVLYVATCEEHDVLRLDASGKVERRWGRKGSAAGEFNLPHMLAFDANGNLYVAEIGGLRLQKLIKK